MTDNPIEAYQQIEKESLDGRALEAAVLTKAAIRLRAVQDQWNSSELPILLEDALKYNQRIWTLLQVELSSPENQLPQEIKGNLLRLSMIVDRRTFDALAFPSPDRLDDLININHNVAAGLRGE